MGGNFNFNMPQQEPFTMNEQLQQPFMMDMNSLGMMNGFVVQKHPPPNKQLQQPPTNNQGMDPKKSPQLNPINFPGKNFGGGFNGIVPQKAAASFADAAFASSMQASLASATTINDMIHNSPPSLQQQQLQASLQPAAQASIGPSSALLPSTTPEDSGWEERYLSLKSYALRFGHTRVPARFKSDPKLGRWVMTQRRQFTLLVQGLPSALSAERIGKLEGLGFCWSVRPEPVATWNAKFMELQAYKASHGDCMVPQRYRANPRLGTWVHTQRRQHRLMLDGRKSSMTREKVLALEGVGFDWDAKHPRQGQRHGTKSGDDDGGDGGARRGDLLVRGAAGQVRGYRGHR